MTTTLIFLFALVLSQATAAPLECTSASERPQWPTYHFFNTLTRDPATGELKMEALNDANAIFEYKGIYHIMMQTGGGNWSHGVSNDLVHWFHMHDALDSDVDFPDRGPACDGSLSFPDLGKAPYDGQAPVMIYDANCAKPLGNRMSGYGVTVSDDVARLKVALPVEPSSPYLTDWVRSSSHSVAFDGPPCAFPSRIWKSEVGEYWNMLCCKNDPKDKTGLANGMSPWARYTSTTPSLMKWTLADEQFTRPSSIPIGGYDMTENGIMFHPIPNPKAGGPTHMINGNSSRPDGRLRGDAFWLGTYDSKQEVMNVDLELGPQLIESGGIYRWAVAGYAGDGRLLTVGWELERPIPTCPEAFGGCGHSVASLVRELLYDHATDQLVSRPVAEYALLHDATFVDEQTVELHCGMLRTLPIPPASGGALDIFVSFDVSKLGNMASGGFGLSVRAAPATTAGAGLTLSFNVSAPDVNGTRLVDRGWAAAHCAPNHDRCNEHDVPVVKILRGETLDVRILVDRPLVEVFVNGGRGAFVSADGTFDPELVSVHLFNFGNSTTVVATNVSVYGMGCGWTSELPKPAPHAAGGNSLSMPVQFLHV